MNRAADADWADDEDEDKDEDKEDDPPADADDEDDEEIEFDDAEAIHFRAYAAWALTRFDPDVDHFLRDSDYREAVL